MSTVMEAAAKNGKPRHRGKVKVSTITLAHGGGGKAMHDLISMRHKVSREFRRYRGICNTGQDL